MPFSGSSRIGIKQKDSIPATTDLLTDGYGTYTLSTFTRGEKLFELSNHLGNVLVTISDRKLQVDSDNNGTIDYYAADIMMATDYYPGGMDMPGRKYEIAGSSYRYSINGQEKTPEIGANTTTAEFWQYDARIVRRWNVDPVVKEYESSYLCFGGNLILLSDVNGDCAGGTCPVCEKDHTGECADPPIPGSVNRFARVNYQGGAGDWLWRSPLNALSEIASIPATIWNSGAATVQSIKNGTFTQDLTAELNGYGNAIKGSWNYTWNTPIGVQLSDTWNALKDPRTFEQALTFFAVPPVLKSVSPANSVVKLTTKSPASTITSTASKPSVPVSQTPKPTSTFLGGAKGQLFSKIGILEGNHMPSFNAFVQAGLKMEYNKLPAIQMLYKEHQMFLTSGPSHLANSFRAAESALLKQGKFLEAFDLNATWIRRWYGNKYDGAIKQARDYYQNEIIPILSGK